MTDPTPANPETVASIERAVRELSDRIVKRLIGAGDELEERGRQIATAAARTLERVLAGQIPGAQAEAEIRRLGDAAASALVHAGHQARATALNAWVDGLGVVLRIAATLLA